MSRNNITGDSLKTKTDNQESYASGWDLIWANKNRTCETYAINPLNIDEVISKLEEEEK